MKRNKSKSKKGSKAIINHEPEWFAEEYNGGSGMRLKVEKRLLSTTSGYQQIDIFDSIKPWGTVLALDNTFQLSTGDQHYYHEMLVHPIMSKHPLPKNVLIIGGGDGGAAKEVLRYKEVENVILVEIDSDVVKYCQEYLPSIGSWADHRLEVLCDDGARFVENFKGCDNEKFDIIIVDSSDPVGPSKELFTRKFYKNCIKSLSYNGVLITQSGSPFTQQKEFVSIIETLRKEFISVWPYFGTVPIYGAGPWSWTWATSNKSSRLISPFIDIIREPKGVKLWSPELDRAAFNYVSADICKLLDM